MAIEPVLGRKGVNLGPYVGTAEFEVWVTSADEAEGSAPYPITYSIPVIGAGFVRQFIQRVMTGGIYEMRGHEIAYFPPSAIRQVNVRYPLDIGMLEREIGFVTSVTPGGGDE
jgi:hypothetical protein